MANKIVICAAFLAAGLLISIPAAPTVSNLRVNVTSATKPAGSWNWTIQATFDLSNTNGRTCRIWPGLKTAQNGYRFYYNLSGDTATTAGTNKVVTFSVKDTGYLNNCSVKITAWDRDGWPPLSNRPFFDKHHFWELDVRQAQVYAQSSGMMTYIQSVGVTYIVLGMGFPIFNVMGNHAKNNVVVCNPYCSDGDNVPIPFPHTSLGDPYNAYVEGGGVPTSQDGDQHMMIIDVENWVDYELYQAYKANGNATGWGGFPCQFDLKRETYSFVSGSGISTCVGYRKNCGATSADAAGWSLATGLVILSELAEGEINHALRFSTCNIKSGTPFYPACHNAGGTANANAWPEGVRIRLKPTINIDQRFPNPANPQTAPALYKAYQVGTILLKAFQKYGLMNSDGQSGAYILVSAESDLHTELKWSDFGGSGNVGTITAQYFYQATNPLSMNDFEVVSPTWQYAQYTTYEGRK